MRPRHYAADNLKICNESWTGYIRFNEAAALRRG